MTIPFQEPKPPALEQWNMGIPDKRIDTLDLAWTWKGRWRGALLGWRWHLRPQDHAEAGSEATLGFTGSAISLVGNYSQEGGKADVYLDGKRRQAKLALYRSQTPTTTSGIYGPSAEGHTLPRRPRTDADSRSRGRKFAIRSAVSFMSPGRVKASLP